MVLYQIDLSTNSAQVQNQARWLNSWKVAQHTLCQEQVCLIAEKVFSISCKLVNKKD